MKMDCGKEIRLGRLLPGERRRGVCLAIDHGMQLGRVEGLLDLEEALGLAAAARFDGVILSPGALARFPGYFAGRDKPAAILRLDQTTMWRMGSPTGYPEGHTRLVSSVREASRLGADAVLTYFFVGHKDPVLENRMFEIAGEVAREAREHGLAYVAEAMAARDGLYGEVFDGETVGSNARMAIEMGADLVKCDWGGSAAGCRKIVEAALGAPVMIAGGPRQGSDEDTIDLVAALLRGGANGVMFGRSLFQSPNRLALMEIVRAMVHDRLKPAKAKKMLAG